MHFLPFLLCALIAVASSANVPDVTTHKPVVPARLANVYEAFKKIGGPRDPCRPDDCSDLPDSYSCQIIADMNVCNETEFIGWCCKSCTNKDKCKV